MTNEELCLLIQLGSNKKDYLEELYLKNKNLIAKIANKYRGYGDPEDLIQEGYFGLVNAAETFDGTKGSKFTTHAFQHIRSCIHRYIENNCNLVRIPAKQRALILKMNRLIDEYYKKHNHKPSIDELSGLMELSKEKVVQLVSDSLFMDIKSTNEPLTDDCEGGACLQDYIADENNYYDEVNNKIQNEQLKVILWDIVDSLDSLQSRIIHERYENNLDANEMGSLLNLSASKVRSIEASAMRELRKQKNYRRLRSFSDERVYSIGLGPCGYSAFNNTWTSCTERAVLFIEGLI